MTLVQVLEIIAAMWLACFIAGVTALWLMDRVEDRRARRRPLAPLAPVVPLDLSRRRRRQVTNRHRGGNVA